MSTPNVLIIDDEPDIRELLSITLERMGLHSVDAEDINSAKQAFSEHDISLCLTDMRLPDGDGLDFVKHVQQLKPNIPVAVITAHGNMETAIQAMRYGAFDFLSKPVDIGMLRTLVANALELQGKQSASQSTTRLIGKSQAIESLRKKIQKVSRSQAPVYIHGESGTGKELVARMIHEQSPRSDKPFVAINCGAIPAELMESEMFGYKKGSFTGAESDTEGLILSAQGGTLFLDEIADLPLNMQVKLLRVLQEKKVRPVGSKEEVPINVRVISASHKNLLHLIERGDFRNDLYYRINVIELNIPSLKERKEDIPLLAQHIIQHQSEFLQDAETIQISDSALIKLSAYSFPGNVRELENILERAMAFCDGKSIDAEDIEGREDERFGASENVIEQKDITEGFDLDFELEAIEKEWILKACEKARWNKTAAAKLLGISFRSLRYKLKKLGLDEE